MKTAFLCYTPFTGLGLFNGFRGNRWLRNRIAVFKHFVLPSWLAQTNRDFIHWISWRPEEKNNIYVKELEQYLKTLPNYKFLFTFTGVAFYDDKYSDVVARERLINALHGTAPHLINAVGECNYVCMLVAPSDDCYYKGAVEQIQNALSSPDLDAVGFSKGYIMDYTTKRVSEYNPITNPPFYTIKFPREVFVDPLRHLEFTSLKHDEGKYKAGTPLPSHEYVKDCLRYKQIDYRGFLVGVHGENISTYYNHPFKGKEVSEDILWEFGIKNVGPIIIPLSIKRKILKYLPFWLQRKVRYWFGEIIYTKFYDFIRS